MDVNKLLQIHQSYSLATIKAINEQVLIAQYAQCEQIVKLQGELASCESTLRQLLKNQLQELHHKEKQRYYKSVVFKISEAIEIIDSESDKQLQSFLLHLYSKILSLNIEDAKENLDEISDKEYCREVERKLKLLQGASFDESNVFCRLLSIERENRDLQEALRCKQNQMRDCHKKLETEPSPKNKYVQKFFRGLLMAHIILWTIFFILALFTGDFDVAIVLSVFVIIGLIPWLILRRKNKNSEVEYKEYVRNWKSIHLDALQCVRDECEAISAQIDALDYIGQKRRIAEICPNWESAVDRVNSYIPRMVKK